MQQSHQLLMCCYRKLLGADQQTFLHLYRSLVISHAALPVIQHTVLA